MNVLVGGILAFVGAIELRRFGPDIYIANLVCIAQVREMVDTECIELVAPLHRRDGGAVAHQS